jgi:FtsP/CotA-like multicopper oxidase with cupredoxin domain
MRDRLGSFEHTRVALFAAILIGCGSGSEPGADDEPAVLEGWDRNVALAELANQDPAPDVVEISLEARVERVEMEPGHEVELWTYNGTMPGPVIRARVGDTLRVHFTNHLPEATTIHWHGVEVPADMDGADPELGTIAPGASFDYEFVLPQAGTYWYHPHVNSSAQVWRGLYGALWVEDPDEPELGAKSLLMVDDIAFEENGELRSSESDGLFGDFFGREGDVLLVNGRVMPRLFARDGDALRLRFVNAATSRYFLLHAEGHELTRVGGDGGLIERPEQVEELLLVPGERADVVLVAKGKVGSTIALGTAPYSRFVCGGPCSEAAPLLEIEIVEGEGHAPPLPSRLRTIRPIDTTNALMHDIAFTQGETEADPPLSINGHAYPDDPFVLHAYVGETHIWNLKNATEYDHPFHLHGFRFQVLSRDGQRPAVAEWKDTLNLPALGSAQIAVAFDDRPGMWMLHCHILDHAKIGMMGMLHLMP